MTAPSAGLRERLEALRKWLAPKLQDEYIATVTEALAALAEREADAEAHIHHWMLMGMGRESAIRCIAQVRKDYQYAKDHNQLPAIDAARAAEKGVKP